MFLVYTQVENHILNPIIMSKTVRISPLLVLISVLVGASIGAWVGGIFGGFVAALLSIPAAGALQVIVRRGLAADRPATVAAEIDAIDAETVRSSGRRQTETIEGVEVTLDEAEPNADQNRRAGPDSAASPEGRHQRP